MFREYFSHDYVTRQDIKIQKLISRHGMLGYGVFWSLVEDLYIHQNKLPYDLETLCYSYRIDEDKLIDIIGSFSLFEVIDGYISCKAVETRLNTRNEKSEKARISAQKRWSKSESNTGAMRSHTESNANKEKEIKEKEIKEKEKTYKNWDIDDFKTEIKNIYLSNRYPMKNEDYVEFLNYWSEKNTLGKFRFQLEKTWDTEKRIARWQRNITEKSFKKSNGAEMLNALNNTYKNILTDEY